MLIREGSPIESFHSFDPQLETLTLSCDSPNNVIDPLTAPTADPLTISTTTTPPSPTNQINTLLTSTTQARNNNNNNSSIESNTIGHHNNNHHHHSDLGLNNLELNFLNDDLTNYNSTNYLKKNASVLKIASNLEINNWENGSTSEFNNNNSIKGGNPHSATSLNFINSDITSCNDNDTYSNNSCEMLHSTSKSKSVELNEFRMMFGSSPTLLNYNPVTQTPRLDAIPFQYRRGYTNLNDACLSSSTSDLEYGKKTIKNHNRGDKNGSGHIGKLCSTGELGNDCNENSNSISQGISSLLQHRNNEPLDYVRSYENLDRTKIIRMKNEKRSSFSSNYGHINHGLGDISSNTNMLSNSNGSMQDWKYTNHFDQFNDNRMVQEEDSSDDFSYSNLGYDNSCGAVGYPTVSNYQSNESLFNINFDAIDDDVFEIDTMGLFENDLATTNSPLLLDEKCNMSGTDSTFTTKNLNSNGNSTNKTSSNQLLLPELAQYSSINGDLPTYQFNSNNIIKSNGFTSKKDINSIGSKTNGNALIKLNDPLSVDVTIAANNELVTPKKSQKLRCAECNKKLGLIMIMKCHCERIFCAQHRYAEAHQCSYDFKTEGQKVIARENPLVVASKLPKI